MEAGGVDGLTRRREPTVDALTPTPTRPSSQLLGYHGATWRHEESGHERAGRIPRASIPKSAALAEQARRAIPGGITHDIRHLSRSRCTSSAPPGARKWDVDGHEYVDYWMGHGSLFLGHCHPAVVDGSAGSRWRAARTSAPATSWRSRWAELVNQLVPCAELTRFTLSGTEATHLAMRLARAFTGRPKILKFAGHFHGWHDGAVAGGEPALRRRRCRPACPRPTIDQVLVVPAQRHQGGRDRARARRRRRR